MTETMQEPDTSPAHADVEAKPDTREPPRAATDAAPSDSPSAPPPIPSNRVSDVEARRQIGIVWIGFVGVQLLLVLGLFVAQWLSRETMLDALEQLNAMYAPYVGLVVAYYWKSAKDQPAAPKSPKSPKTFAREHLRTAVVATALWNIIVLGLIVNGVFVAAVGLPDTLEVATKVGSYLSWLVAGALGLFFATASEG